MAECLNDIYSVSPGKSCKRSHKAQELDDAQPNKSGQPNPGTSGIWMTKKARLAMGKETIQFILLCNIKFNSFDNNRMKILIHIFKT